jgi:hypothetical protein
MWHQCLNNALAVWFESLIGSAVAFVCMGIGWRAGAIRESLAVRVTMWWLTHVVRPLFASRSWLRRLLIIAGNNSLMCAIVVVLGRFGHLAWLGVSCIGLGLGIALRLMLSVPVEDHDDSESQSAGIRVLTGIGLGLNLIEVPALMLTTGLALSQGALSSSLDVQSALTVFAAVALPMLIISAAGEALWMTINPKLPNF